MALFHRKQNSKPQTARATPSLQTLLSFWLWWWRRGYHQNNNNSSSGNTTDEETSLVEEEEDRQQDEINKASEYFHFDPNLMMEALKINPDQNSAAVARRRRHRHSTMRWLQICLLVLILCTAAGLWIYMSFEFDAVQNMFMRTFSGQSSVAGYHPRRLGRKGLRLADDDDAVLDPYIFEMPDLPTDFRFIPTISNGHIATTMYDNCLKMNALYNGESGSSHPACIPSPFKLTWKRYSHFSTPPPVARRRPQSSPMLHAIEQLARPPPLTTAHAKVLIGDKYLVTGQAFRLDVRTGTFHEFTNITILTTGQQVGIEKRSYMHRSPAHNRIYAVEMLFEELSPPTANGPITELVLPYVSIIPMILTSTSQPMPVSDDLIIAPIQVATIGNVPMVCLMNATTKTSEYSVVPPLNVSMVWTCGSETDPSTNVTSEGILRLRANETTTLLASISVTQDDAVQHFISAWGAKDTLYALHVQAWAALWSTGRIEVDAAQNFNLSQAVAAVQYYLWSDIRLLENDVTENNATPSVLDTVPFMGLPPGGLAKGAAGDNYQGHIFWDMDTWMFPGILWTQPLLARQLIRARAFQLDAARVNAAQQNDSGARFPWESARSGWEVSPWNVSGVYEIHVSCDVAMALKLYIETTGDVDAIMRYRFGEMAFGIAEYYYGRSVVDINGTRHINSVCPPDEYHAPVNDSVYTNFCAAKSLLLPEYLCNIGGANVARPAYCTNTSMLNTFGDAADALIILTDQYQGQTYHPEFAGFIPFKNDYPYLDPVLLRQTTKLGLVKQADAIMLQYPLMANETLSIQQNDLNVYEQCTDIEGPAMTWGTFAVNLLELGSLTSADRNFNKQYANIVPGFGMWSESPAGTGAVNFLTGMGGFLQSIVNGYFGLRIDVGKYAQPGTDIDVFNCFRLQPRALPGNVPFNIVGLNFQNTTFNVEVTDALYTYVTLDMVPQNVRVVQICDKLLSKSNDCRDIVPGQEVVVAGGAERFICLTFV